MVTLVHERRGAAQHVLANPVIDDDKRQCCLLRALEWNNWPVFLGQSIVPILLTLLAWWIVIPSIVAADLLWSWRCERFADLLWAERGVVIARLRWVISTASGAWLLLHGNPGIAVVAGIWPFLTLVLVFAHPPTRAIALQDAFLQDLTEKPRSQAAPDGNLVRIRQLT